MLLTGLLQIVNSCKKGGNCSLFLGNLYKKGGNCRLFPTVKIYLREITTSADQMWSFKCDVMTFESGHNVYVILLNVDMRSKSSTISYRIFVLFCFRTFSLLCVASKTELANIN
jgi:hypothetical protein